MKITGIILALALLMATTLANEQQETAPESQLTAEQIEALLERAMAEAAAEDDDCGDKELMSCIGIDQAVCEAFRADIIGDCTLPMARDILTSDEDVSENLELRHAQCTLTLAEKKYRIPPTRYLGCMPAGTYEKPELIEEWIKNR